MTKGRRSVRYNTVQASDELRAADPVLGRLMDRVGPFTLSLASQLSPFEALLESIVYQQIHGKAADAILNRLKSHYGSVHPQPEQLLATPEEVLRAAGLSANKQRALRDLAAKTLDDTVPTLAQIRRMKDEEIIERLVTVRGIGQWTVEMLLIFRLGRPNVLPVTDYGIRKGFALTFQRLPPGKKVEPSDLPRPDVILKRGKRWQPWSSVAAWYLWRACDLAAKKPPSGRA
jgi:DNA-3-methyladenine glycosylase II